ncbi:MAG TPA: hypothetical protein VN855_00450 [Candidatus Acidoferrum sp.]|nr:hypothetical protein [Candidatus Acidoferrum sp.]
MNDEDKAFVKDIELPGRLLWVIDKDRLCRIIRELETQNETLTNALDEITWYPNHRCEDCQNRIVVADKALGYKRE